MAWCLAVGMSVVVVGCAGMAEQRRQDRFEKTARAYERAIRWSDFETAYALTKPDPSRPPDFERMKRFQVTSYETLGALPSAGYREIRLTAAIEYVHTGSMRVRKLVDQQVWSFSEDDGRWQLVSGLPAFD
jgi:hypothetical protein